MKCFLGFIVLATLWFFVVVPADAQNIHIGIVGGANFTNLDLDILEMGDDISLDMNGSTSIGIGAAADLPLYRNLHLRLEPMYLKRGGGLQSDIPFELPNIGLSYESSFIEVPVMFRAEFGKSLRPYVLAGPTVGFLLDSHITVEFLGIGVRCSLQDITKTVQFGFTYGAGIHYPVDNFFLFIEGRYTVGLSDIIEGGPLSIQIGDERIEENINEEDVEMKTKGLQLMMGITVPLGNK
jgi:hypothetical protein